jgi:hypothetical protein
VDVERDTVETMLARAQQVTATFRVTGIGMRGNAHNADGERYDTDGELRVVVLSPNNVRHPAPEDPGVAPVVALKDRIWRWTHRAESP